MPLRYRNEISGTSSFPHTLCSLENITQCEDHVEHLGAVDPHDSSDENNSQCNCFNAGLSGHSQSTSPACQICSISNVPKNGSVCSSCGQYFHLPCIHITKRESEYLSVWDCLCCLRRSSVVIHPSRIEVQNASHTLHDVYEIRNDVESRQGLLNQSVFWPLIPCRIASMMPFTPTTPQIGTSRYSSLPSLWASIKILTT